jgi:hypothetical protein
MRIVVAEQWRQGAHHMTATISNRTYRGGGGHDHFEPEAFMDPMELRKLRGHLEQIDYSSFAANREILAQALGATDLTKFQRLAVAAAQARAHWVSAAVGMVADGQRPSPAQIVELSTLRTAYEELVEAYNGLRRMVERGYLHFHATK